MSSRATGVFSAAVTNTVVTVVESGPHNLRMLTFLNTTAAPAYLQIFNTAAPSVTLGTTIPTLSIGVPASAGIVVPIPSEGINLGGNGISVAGTTGRTNSTAAILHINLGYGG